MEMSNTSKTSKMTTKKKKVLTIATWNVRTLVESTGDECVCRRRAYGTLFGNFDRKLDLVVRELKRHRVSIAGIQESKWFGSYVWEAGEHILLHSGRPLPQDDKRPARNEGVGIVLDMATTKAWKNAGKVWEAVSSRIVMARLYQPYWATE